MSSETKTPNIKSQPLTDSQARRLGEAHIAVVRAQQVVDAAVNVRGELVAMLLDAAGIPANAQVNLEQGIIVWEEAEAPKAEAPAKDSKKGRGNATAK